MKCFALLSLACACLPSCISFFPEPAFLWADEEHYWRIDGARDVVEWIEIEHGLTSLSEDAPEQLRAVLNGRAVFPPCGGFPSIALDDLAGGESATERDAAVNVHVVGAHLVLDDRGRITLWRRTRIERATALMDAFQREAWLRATDKDASGPPGFGVNVAADSESRELQHAALLSGLRVWQLDGDAFVLELPMTAACAQRCIDAWKSDPVDPRVRPPAEVSFSESWLRVRWIPDETGWIGAKSYDVTTTDFQGSIPHQDSGSARARARLEGAGLTIEPRAVYASLRRDAGLRAK